MFILNEDRHVKPHCLYCRISIVISQKKKNKLMLFTKGSDKISNYSVLTYLDLILMKYSLWLCLLKIYKLILKY